MQLEPVNVHRNSCERNAMHDAIWEFGLDQKAGQVVGI
jgi:hypothetical protein